MKKDSGKTALPSRATYDVLEEMARLKIQAFIQDVFYEEIAAFLRRGKSERIKGIDIPKNYRNGNGKPHKLAALGEIHPHGEEQRCWNHKIINVLNAMPKGVRAEAAEYLSKIPYAETKKECQRLIDAFAARYRKDYLKAVEKLLSDWDRMVAFYCFPKDHWVHIRTKRSLYAYIDNKIGGGAGIGHRHQP